jgi:NADPH2:quinone reductase
MLSHLRMAERASVELPEGTIMRAVTVNAYGSDPVVAIVPTPEPKAGQLLIKLTAAGMNPMDRALASGAWRPMPVVFPMVPGADFAGVIEAVGDGATRFSAGESVFGQSFTAPLGSAGTYAEYLAVAEDAPLALVPARLDPVIASALPTAGMTAILLVDDVLAPLDGRTVLIVGAGGGVGSFAVQFAVNAGARVIANVREAAAERMRGYGVQEVVDDAVVPLADAVRQAHPDGVDVLIDLISDAEAFQQRAELVRKGGTAVTTRYVADTVALGARGVTGVNFALQPSGETLVRLADALVAGRIVAPPITRISLDDVPAFLDAANERSVEGKTVITLGH